MSPCRTSKRSCRCSTTDRRPADGSARSTRIMPEAGPTVRHATPTSHGVASSRWADGSIAAAQVVRHRRRRRGAGRARSCSARRGRWQCRPDRARHRPRPRRCSTVFGRRAARCIRFGRADEASPVRTCVVNASAARHGRHAAMPDSISTPLPTGSRHSSSTWSTRPLETPTCCAARASARADDDRRA